MDGEFAVGDVVEQRDSGKRMKVESVDADGRFVCAWKHGVAQHRKRFTADLLQRCRPPERML